MRGWRSQPDLQQVMTLTADEVFRRFLLHVLPKGFHRIRHYGLFAGAIRRHNCAGRPGSPAAVPLLQQAHGRHRDLRTLVLTKSPAGRVVPTVTTTS
jgi:hypothetical protein